MAKTFFLSLALLLLLLQIGAHSLSAVTIRSNSSIQYQILNEKYIWSGSRGLRKDGRQLQFNLQPNLRSAEPVYQETVEGSSSPEVGLLGGSRARSKREQKRTAYKLGKLKQAVNKVESMQTPASLQPDTWCKPHNKRENAVFAAALDLTYSKYQANHFLGTLRNTGFTGDIVVAVLPGSRPGFLQSLRDFDALTYTLDETLCVGDNADRRCQLEEGQEQASMSMIRFFLYQHWAKLYDENVLIMLSDFRNVFFQSNPFSYKISDWGPPNYQLVMFQEAVPNKMLYRCPSNSAWIRGCYGEEALDMVADNPVASSGATIGTRDATMVYAYLMTQQINPLVRFSRLGLAMDPVKAAPADNKRCSESDIDQAFHNFLLYSGQLSKIMDVKVYPQGEGPVNTIGGFAGDRDHIVIKKSLHDWKVIRGAAPNLKFYNWNNDPSPAVHQWDLFLNQKKYWTLFPDIQRKLPRYIDAFKDFKYEED